ncbi:MAG: hypothetical protein Q9183_007158, partial [Haloplaca sp. 2 TL-2023]
QHSSAKHSTQLTTPSSTSSLPNTTPLLPNFPRFTLLQPLFLFLPAPLSLSPSPPPPTPSPNFPAPASPSSLPDPRNFAFIFSSSINSITSPTLNPCPSLFSPFSSFPSFPSIPVVPDLSTATGLPLPSPKKSAATALFFLGLTGCLSIPLSLDDKGGASARVRLRPLFLGVLDFVVEGR